MRYAIFADIHANLEALRAVLRVVDGEKIDRVVCLGDIVGYFTNPNECVRVIMSRGIVCVRGNHDAVAAGLYEPEGFGQTGRRAIFWTRTRLSADKRRFLAELPQAAVIDNEFVAVHAALHPQPNEWLRIHGESEAAESFEAMQKWFADLSICFFGHTHCPVIYERRGQAVRTIDESCVVIEPGAQYLVNPGSVGQSRDGDQRAAFAVYDSEKRTIRLRRVTYDFMAARRKAWEAGILRRPSALRRSASWVKRKLLSVGQ